MRAAAFAHGLEVIQVTLAHSERKERMSAVARKGWHSMVTLNELRNRYRDYLQYERGLAKQTVTAYLNDIDRLTAFLGNCDIETVTLDQLRAHMRDMAQSGLNANTIRRRIHSLSTFYGFLELENITRENLPKKLRLPKKKEHQPYWLSPEELHRFVETPSRLTLAWQLLAWFGLRRSELLNLRWEDIRWDGSLLIVKGKGERERIIPIPNAMFDILYENWLSLGKPEGRIISLGKSPFARAFKRHVVNCGLDPAQVTPHTLRHTFGSHLSQQGIDITIIKSLMGHKDIKTTMIYIHLHRDRMIDAMEKHLLNM